MADGVVLSVRVTPRAGRDEVVGPDEDGVLRVRVAAAPADGGANRSVLRTLAASLDVPPSAIEILSGTSSRTKRLRIGGMAAADVLARWPGVALSQSTGSR